MKKTFRNLSVVMGLATVAQMEYVIWSLSIGPEKWLLSILVTAGLGIGFMFAS